MNLIILLKKVTRYMTGIQDINLEEGQRGDEADLSFLASYLDEKSSLERVKEAMNPKNQIGYVDFDGEHCVDCDEKLSEIRLKIGSIRCVNCQTELEHYQNRQAKLFG